MSCDLFMCVRAKTQRPTVRWLPEPLPRPRRSRRAAAPIGCVGSPEFRPGTLGKVQPDAKCHVSACVAASDISAFVMLFWQPGFLFFLSHQLFSGSILELH